MVDSSVAEIRRLFLLGVSGPFKGTWHGLHGAGLQFRLRQVGTFRLGGSFDHEALQGGSLRPLAYRLLSISYLQPYIGFAAAGVPHMLPDEDKFAAAMAAMGIEPGLSYSLCQTGRR